MKKSTVLTGVVLLESYWALRKKDMIDLISPFILYWVARTTSIHDEVNVLMVSEKVCAEFGYINIPPSVIEKVLSRNKKHFSKIKKKYYLSESLDSENLLIYDDNKNALLNLLHTTYKGKVKLVYIDPPFSSSSNFVSKNQNLAYKDTLGGGEYLEFLRERLVLIKEMLSNDGSIYLHLDGNMAFPMKIIMDELFGSSNCRSFITRKKCGTKNYTKNSFGNISDYRGNCKTQKA